MNGISTTSGRHRLRTLPKAVVFRRGKVLLARAQDDPAGPEFWELPGNPVPDDVDPAVALRTQVRSDTGQDVVVGPQILEFRHPLPDGSRANIIVFGCTVQDRLPLQVSLRYRQVAWLPVDDLPENALLDGYVAAIDAWNRDPSRMLVQHS